MKERKLYSLISPNSKEYVVSSSGTGYVRIKGGLRKLTPYQLESIQAAESQCNAATVTK